MTQPPATGATAPVLFLSGAGLAAWLWDDVRRALPDRDSVVVRYPRGADVSLADYADQAAEQAPAGTFAVVAHSVGGVVAAELLARHPERVTGLLGVSAVVPRAGRSFLGTLPIPARFVVGAMMRLLGTRPPERSVRALAGDLPPDTAERVVREFDPEAVRLYRDAVSAASTLPPVRGYLLTTDDRELPAPVQRASAHALRATWTDELPTGHLPMLQDPDGVTRAVRRLLAEVDG